MKTTLLAVFFAVLAAAAISIAFSAMLAPESGGRDRDDGRLRKEVAELRGELARVAGEVTRLEAARSGDAIPRAPQADARTELPGARSEEPPPCDRHCAELHDAIARLTQRIDMLENHLRFGGQLTDAAPGKVSGKRGWGPEQATGAPDTASAGDRSTAWASRTPDDGEEWLQVGCGRELVATGVRIHETYNPGAVTRVSVFDQGSEIVVWEGIDPTSREKSEGISHITFPGSYRTSQVRIYLDSRAVPGWNEIDAVALIDERGQPHWATEASASSSYADASATTATLEQELAPKRAGNWQGFRISK